jgi:hypothetical protein
VRECLQTSGFAKEIQTGLFQLVLDFRNGPLSFQDTEAENRPLLCFSKQLFPGAMRLKLLILIRPVGYIGLTGSGSPALRQPISI